MAKGYNNHNHQITRQTHYSKNFFLPVLCRASINDVKLSDFKDHSFSSLSGDPSSPKVSCMGQIKKNSKLIIPFSTPYRLTSSPVNTSASKSANISRKKLFSSKTFTAKASAVTTATVYGGDGRSCQSSGRESISYINWKRSSKINNEEGNHQPGKGHVRLDLKELDPPLPVIKKPLLPPPEENLWSRRRSSGGMALKNLHIQHQINSPNKKINQPAPTV